MDAPGSAPAVVRPPPGHPRFPLFDSLRAIAALAIFGVHSAILSGAFVHDVYWRITAHLDIGVTIFFLLSGFLLYRPFVATRVLGSPEVRTADYAKRRFLRIAPAYWVALTALAVVPGIYGAFSGNWWVYYGLLQNYPVYEATGDCAADAFRCGIAPTWTLAVEVFFYASLPLFALGMAALARRVRGVGWLTLELVVLGALALVSVVIQARGLEDDVSTWLFYSPIGRAWWFGLGMALAALSVRAAQREAEPRAIAWLADRAGLVWATALAIYLVAVLFVLSPGPGLAVQVGISTGEYIGEYILAGLIAALILLPAAFSQGRDGPARRLMGNRVLAWLGLISYGIFLYHYPVLIGVADIGALDWWPAMGIPVMTITALAITIACATLSYYLVERPLMRLKYRGDDRRLSLRRIGRNRPALAEDRAR